MAHLQDGACLVQQLRADILHQHRPLDVREVLGQRGLDQLLGGQIGRRTAGALALELEADDAVPTSIISISPPWVRRSGRTCSSSTASMSSYMADASFCKAGGRRIAAALRSNTDAIGMWFLLTP